MNSALLRFAFQLFWAKCHFLALQERNVFEVAYWKGLRKGPGPQDPFQGKQKPEEVGEN